MSKSINPPKRYRIGYALPAKKVDNVITQSLVTHLTDNANIDLVSVDPTKPLIEQGPFDCIVHKIYDSDWISQIHQFSSQNPNVPIIDSPDSIVRLHSRDSMLKFVTRLRLREREEILDIPKQIVVSDSDVLKRIDLGELGLGFPLIAKPIEANGSAKSHRMFWVFDLEGLKKLETPVVLQKFVNHGGVLFKVYVAGNYVKCVKRKSLPDMSNEKLRNLNRLVSFSQISNMAVEGNKGGSVDFDGVEMPSAEFVEEVAMAMKEEMKLNLFNFDMIRDARDGNRYLVIDINYFPGYAKMPDSEAILTRFFLDVLEKKESGSKNGVLDNKKGSTEQN